MDSGAWTWDHVDHFHYYRGAARNIGRVDGEGTATIATGLLSTAGTTGMFFPNSGEAVLLDNPALSGGTITETLRIKTEPHAGLIAPLGEGAVVTEPDNAEEYPPACEPLTSTVRNWPPPTAPQRQELSPPGWDWWLAAPMVR